MEPVLIATDILLHGDVHIWLVKRDARHVRECEIDKVFYVHVVSGGIAICRGSARAINEAVDWRRLIIHGVEDRFSRMVAPVEKVFRIIEPPGEYVGEQRHRFLGQFGTPICPRHLVDRGLNANLRETLLHQNADRLPYAGKAAIEKKLDRPLYNNPNN